MGQRLGQHFLRDDRIIRRIMDAADLQPEHHVLEVGPGPGVLTAPLAKKASKVTAVEADPALADALYTRWDNVNVVLNDVMNVDLAKLGPFDRIVSNLPYQISGPVTFSFLELLKTAPWGHAVLMYQKEFADRLIAAPGSKQYGRLSVHVARWCQTEKVTEVSPAAFDPPPKVRSMVVKLTPHESAPFEVKDDALWQQVVDFSFGQRRKQLKNTLAAIPGAVDALESLGLATERPEQVSPAQFAQIVAALV